MAPAPSHRRPQNTEYDEDISAEDPHIRMFWSVLASFSEQEKSAFLRFVWARPLPPKGGLSSEVLGQGCAGSRRASHSRAAPACAHTCFFSINLPGTLRST